MEKIANDTLSLWREEGRQQIKENFEVFRSLVAQARKFVQCGNYEAAAVYGEIAAFYATGKHCGLFVSPELEQALIKIGREAIPRSIYSSESLPWSRRLKNILHVSTSVMSVGGHSRMLWRWIQQDTERSHSVVLTRQAPNKVPKVLQDAVNNSQGKIYILNERIGSVISWAKQLRQIAAAADLVVLHMHNYDVIPIIAFANKEQSPPIIFLDHADHLFGLGIGVSDLIVNLRESGMRLSQERRGVEAERNALLPIILEPTQRTLSRTEAKRQLGIPKNSILLLSIARAIKYRKINGISFADAHIPLLKKHKQAILVVIGPGNREDWSEAIKKTQGRIRSLNETEDIAIFYQAADIYVDSFPFISNTSLLEAGSYGIPLVTRYPYSDASVILGADMPGLTGNLICVRDLEEYTKILWRLVEDEEFRLALGEATRRKIAQTHWGNNWQCILEKVYLHAATLPRVSRTLASKDQIFLDEPDVFLPRVHGRDFDVDHIIQSSMRIMPFTQRWLQWLRLGKSNGFMPFSLLLPEWLYIRYIRFRIGLGKYLNPKSLL